MSSNCHEVLTKVKSFRRILKSVSCDCSFGKTSIRPNGQRFQGIPLAALLDDFSSEYSLVKQRKFFNSHKPGGLSVRLLCHNRKSTVTEAM